MSLYDIVILTDSRYVSPSSPGQYVQNILTEDQMVFDALERKGLSVSRKDWADPEMDWSGTSSVLFRTTWDYFDRFGEFKNWLLDTSSKTKLINSASLIQWNMDKHYLNELTKAGVRVVPTRYIEVGSKLSLQRLHEITGWTDTVIKPTVGGAGRHTHRISEDNLHIIERKLHPVLELESFMLQPFQYSVPVEGEKSLIFFGTEFSHAVLKKARPGDFRVQDDFGGTVHKYEATEEEIDFGLQAIYACPELPAYARVDFITDNSGSLAISELELIEPELWFRLNPSAAEILAEEILTRLG